MAYRWKTNTNPVNEIRTNPGDPGYTPVQPQPLQLQPIGMNGNETWRTQYDVPQTQRAAYMDEYEADQDRAAADAMRMQENRAAIQQEISTLRTELAGVEQQIQEIDARYPRLKGGDKEWEIAAKRAEIGDMSAYDSMMNRGAGAASAASGIENGLYNAGKLLYGLDSKDDYEQGAFANQIEMELRKAEEWAHRNPGQQLPPIYQDVKNRYDEWKAKKDNAGPANEDSGFIVDNADKTVNSLEAMVKNGTYDRAKEAAGYEWVKNNPNSPYTKTIREWLKANKYNTKEAKAEAAAFNKRIADAIKSKENLTPKEQKAWFDSLPQKERDAVSKKIVWKTREDGEEYFERKK